MANGYIESIKHAIGFLLGQPRSEGDAIEMLKADHRRVKELVSEFKNAEDQEKRSLCTKIMIELTVHAKLEEELVYPLIRKQGEEENSQVDEAAVEHDCVKYLISELAGQGPSDDKFDAKVIVLGELVDHHVKEEENEMFPALRASNNDMIDLGDRLAKRKEELLHEIKERPNFADDEDGKSARRSGHRSIPTRERKGGRTKPGKRDAKASPKKGATKSGAASKKSPTSGNAGAAKSKASTTKSAAKSKAASSSKATSKTKPSTSKTLSKGKAAAKSKTDFASKKQASAAASRSASNESNTKAKARVVKKKSK